MFVPLWLYYAELFCVRLCAICSFHFFFFFFGLIAEFPESPCWRSSFGASFSIHTRTHTTPKSNTHVERQWNEWKHPSLCYVYECITGLAQTAETQRTTGRKQMMFKVLWTFMWIKFINIWQHLSKIYIKCTSFWVKWMLFVYN